MPRSASVACIARLVVAVAAAAAGCGGKVVRLGCPHAQVKANEVLWIGDSWMLVPASSAPMRVQDLARAAGAIGASDDYTIGAAAATTMPTIAGQYDTEEAGATKVKALIEDGGTWETINAMMNGTTVASAASGAASAFSQHLAKVVSDGTVEHVIYFLPPELSTIPGVVELRPLVKQACAQSTVPCHFLDLEPIWSGHPEYSVGFLPSDAGATVLANAIWAVMQQNCVAQ